jgi:hypothetical protein
MPGSTSFVQISPQKPKVATNSAIAVTAEMPGLDDPETLFLMRGFPDVSSREPLKAEFYEEDLWKKALEHILLPMLEKYEVGVVFDNTASFVGNHYLRERTIDTEQRHRTVRQRGLNSAGNAFDSYEIKRQADSKKWL